MCFLYRYYNCLYVKDYDLALENTLQFNSKFSQPLPRSEVIHATKKAEQGYEEWLKNEPVVKNGKVYSRGGYNYTGNKLIELLKVLPVEQEQMQTLIGIDEKYKRNNIKRNKSRRNDDGLTSREQQKNKRIEEVKELKKQGLNNTEIAKQLGISRVYVSKIINS